MRIAQLAHLTGTTPRQLRHYEAQGLLHPARDERGWRDYDQSDRRRVGEIHRLIRAGIPTGLAQRLLDLPASPQARAKPMDGDTAVTHSTEYEQVLADVVAYYHQLDARAQCLSRNRDALGTWLAERGLHDRPVRAAGWAGSGVSAADEQAD